MHLEYVVSGYRIERGSLVGKRHRRWRLLAAQGDLGQLAKLSENSPRDAVAWARNRRKLMVAIAVQIRVSGTIKTNGRSADAAALQRYDPLDHARRSPRFARRPWRRSRRTSRSSRSS